ncbi:MAG: Gfo/Idh/MocA family oxidoreductase [Lysobacteraceae bacterium]|nr:MAG: Gfo/Idh/MocA family oxidoreductase [Xanthomonadaceae bacterium]
MGPMTLRIAIVGVGKIARDQHVPSIMAVDGVDLVATASRNGSVDGIPAFESLEAMMEAGPAFDAVALCTPPQGRHRLAAMALAAGKHVMLEKPPGATVAEVESLIAMATARGVTLFAAWHSRFAPAVEPARAFLAQHAPRRVTIQWREDVRVWHPGQTWLWEPGGLGVFDPGINALSILTRILPRPVFLTEAELSFPSNRASPIAAELSFTDGAALDVRASFDFLQTGPQTWDIEVETQAGLLSLSGGGAAMRVDGVVRIDESAAEYPALYRRFATLVETGNSDVDLTPLTHVADAFMLGHRVVVDAFDD